MTEATKYYRSAAGAYLGGFAGATPPDGAVEVDSPPSDARQTWDTSAAAWAELSDADIADATSLSRRQLFEEIDDLLPINLRPAEVWLPAVVAVTPLLTDEQRAAALSAINRSQTFEGSSPLFLLVGAALTPPLDADEIHQLIIRASER